MSLNIVDTKLSHSASASVTLQFIKEAEKNGLPIPEAPIADGSFHRYKVEPDNRENSFYVLHLTSIPWAIYGCYKRGLEYHWCAKDLNDLTPEEHENYQRELAQAKADEKENRRVKHAEAAKRAFKLWNVSEEVIQHPYLDKKQVKAYGLRQHKDTLLVPMVDVNGDLKNYQRIYANGDKKFLDGAQVESCFHILSSKNNDVIYIAEGYSTAATVHEITGHTSVVAFGTGNLKSVLDVIHIKYPDSEIVLLADNDQYGDGNAGVNAAFEAGAPTNNKVVIPTFKDTSTKPTDFNDLYALEGKAEVHKQLTNTHAITVRLQPDPLRREPQPPTPYPIDALGSVLAPAAKRLMEVVKAPDSVCGQSLLAAAAIAVQGHANVIIDGRILPLVLFCITVADSGERKSAIDGEALRKHYQYEKYLADEYREKSVVYEQELTAYKQIRDSIKKSKKGEEVSRESVQAALAELGEEPEAPLSPMLICEEPTYEGLTAQLAKGLPSIGLFSDEGGQFVGGYALSKDQALKTVAGLSKLWDGKHINRVRGSESYNLYGKRLSLHLMVQESVADLLFNSKELQGQGFLSRCLSTWPATRCGSRTYRAFDLTSDSVMQNYWNRIGELLEAELPIEEGTNNVLEPRNIPLSDDGKKLWVEFHNKIEFQLGTDKPLAPIRSFACKIAEHAARMSGVLALLDDIKTREIGLPYVEAGIRLAQFYLSEMLRIHDTGAIDPDILLAEKLYQWCLPRGEVYAQEIYRKGPSAIRVAKTAKRIAGILEKHGCLTRIEGGKVIDGTHRRDVWKVETGE